MNELDNKKELFQFAKKRQQIHNYPIFQSETKLFWKRFFNKKSNIVIFSFLLAFILLTLILLCFVKFSPIHSIDNKSDFVNNLPPYYSQIITRNFERGYQLDLIRSIENQESIRAAKLGIKPIFRILYDSARDSGGSLTVNTDIVALTYNPYDLIKAINLNQNSININILNKVLLGTTESGIDIYSRIFCAFALTTSIILLAIFINIFIGFSLAAFYVFNRYKWYGIVIDKIAVTLNAIPEIIWIFLLCIFLGTNWYGILVAFILISWISFYELSKNEILNLIQKEYIKAAKIIGLNNFQITYRHLFKNVLPSLIILIADRLAINILIVASLAFLDFLTAESNLNIGTIFKEALSSIKVNPQYLIIVAVYITVFCILLKLFSIGLSMTYDPKISKNY